MYRKNKNTGKNASRNAPKEDKSSKIDVKGNKTAKKDKPQPEKSN